MMITEIPDFFFFFFLSKMHFNRKIEILFFILKCSPFISKLFTENRFQIRSALNELKHFKILLNGGLHGQSGWLLDQVIKENHMLA